jgi:3-hydroxybutyryl-CoA dehydrogenase
MENIQIKKVGIAGAGTMGAGIALVCAQAGYEVVLFDIQDQMLEKAKTSIDFSLNKFLEKGKIDQKAKENILGRLTLSSDKTTLVADLIIEAIVEKADIKIGLFQELIHLNGPNTIFASNTSSIPITQIAAGVTLPENIIGIHFFNPALLMKLVEIVKGAKSNQKYIEAAYEFVKSLGKTPVVAADAPGFIVNRIARLYYVESLKILEENLTSFEDIDGIMESCGFKMGPFKLMDLIGVDTNYSVTESQYKLFNFETRFKPNRIQKQKVDAGLHGKKTGEGFYKYENK